ncbi:hypothetical protein [Rarobacter incanus]|uniref:Uncharacterized protein n=1 Tax=Rarobacter incanus TaxID=153494 RepID=A0A542SQN9_9MICO|nr:hypothetical protein [Rarobacter incanus]TQK76915.1 hypothetical protein FB389_1617 [Rarobacter incanus]
MNTTNPPARNRRYAQAGPLVFALVVALAAAGAIWRMATSTFADPAAKVAAAATAQGQAQPTYLFNCAGNPREHPSSIVLACGDGNESINAIQWTTWGLEAAKGTALYEVNDCEPSCAEGKQLEFPVAVTLSNLYRGESSQYYRDLTVTFTENRPPWVTSSTQEFDVDNSRSANKVNSQ